MFNRSFLKFFFGFIFLIALGLISVVVVQAYSDREGTVFELLASFFN